MGVEIVTLGCRLNVVESQVARARAVEAGLGDALLINTCAVTGEAVRQARQAIRRARRDMPGRRIVVTGCAAQTDPDAFAGMDEVDLVLGNAEKLTTGAYEPLARAAGGDGLAPDERVRVGDIMAVRGASATPPDRFSGRARAFVQIQNGCDHRCTFCIIPFGRGNSRSVAAGAIIDQVARLVDDGFREIVLTGVDITSWGADLPGAPRLGVLLRTILRATPGLARLRLSSIDSVEVDPDFLRAIAEEERLMPHLHLSLQAGDDVILKRMKRRHSRADAVALCAELRRLRSDIALGADLIAGFPTETEAMFANSLAIIDACGLTHLHVFPYSARARTPAARMPQVAGDVVKRRAARLRAAGAAALGARLAKEPGQIRSVLVEAAGFGRTEHYAPVALDGGARGAVRNVLIRAATADSLVGEIIEKAA